MKSKCVMDYTPQLDKEEMAIALVQKQVRIDKVQRKIDNLKKQEKYKELQEMYRLHLTTYLTAKPTDKHIKELIQKFCLKINTEACKFLLRCYGVPFKVKDMYSNLYKEKVAEVLEKIVRTPEQLAKLILYLDRQPYNISINNLDNIKGYMRRLK